MEKTGINQLATHRSGDRMEISATVRNARSLRAQR